MKAVRNTVRSAPQSLWLAGVQNSARRDLAKSVGPARAQMPAMQAGGRVSSNANHTKPCFGFNDLQCITN